MNFRLIYDGPLASNGTAKEKQEIRRVLHPQLAELWRQPPLEVFVREGRLSATSGPDLRLVIVRGNFTFAPVVTSRLGLIAHLDILFLRPGPPGSLITQGGDIDNRLKTLFDALQVPDANQIAGETPLAGETPFFCALENDALLTRVNVDTDRLLTTDAGGIGASRVHLIINVRLRATVLTWDNMDLVS